MDDAMLLRAAKVGLTLAVGELESAKLPVHPTITDVLDLLDGRLGDQPCGSCPDEEASIEEPDVVQPV